ncbi:MAG: hypothetical protein GY720_24170, partial [bacterium]|nr:hypothetical protein [bacterium]
MAWLNPGHVDSGGGVSSAGDECILHYVRVKSTRTRHLSIDADNNLWVSGRFGGNDRHFDLVEGDTGQILRTEYLPCGGYGGFVDRHNVLWSASRNASLLRWDIDAGTSKCIGGVYAYGLGIAPDGWVWVSDVGASKAWKVSPDGNTVLGHFGTASKAQGLAVDSRGHAWISSHLWNQRAYISHMKADGTYLGRVNGVPIGSTGVAIDSNGKIWTANWESSTASRIDPTRGPIGADGVTPLGEVDLIVQLPGAMPYNYSDM